MSNNPGQTQVPAAPTTVADTVPTQGIDFGYCGINQTATRTLIISNPGTSGGIVRYEIQTDQCPFTITPLAGKPPFSKFYLTSR